MKANLKHLIRNVVNSLSFISTILTNNTFLILKTLLSQVCIICGKSYMDKALCLNCYNKMLKSKPIGVDWIHSDLSYGDKNVKRCVHHFKYYNKKEIIVAMTNYYIVNMYSHIKDKVKQNYLSIKDIKRNGDDRYATIYLVPIPISPDRLIERGYNQSMIIAQTIKSELKNKYNTRSIILEDYIVRTKISSKLSSAHNIEDRVEITENSMEINSNQKEKIKNNKENITKNLQHESSLYILLDDVTTTGTTFYAARVCLMSAGISTDNIIAISLAH